MDCFRRICCCFTPDVDRWQTESSPLVENPYPPIDMTDVEIYVQCGYLPKILSDLKIHEVCISYHTTLGWMLVEGSGRSQTAHSLTKDEEQSISDVVVHTMQYRKDQELFTITVKIPIGTSNITTGHSYTEVSLTN